MSKHVDPVFLSKLRRRLADFDGKAISILGETEAEFVNTQGYLAILLELAIDAESNIASGATWLIKSALEKGAKLPARLIENLIDNLDRISAWDAQLHICQSVQYFDIAESEAENLIAWAKPLLDHDRPFLRAWSMDAHCRIGVNYPHLVSASDIVDRGLADEAASVRARARNLRQSGV